jgi:MerR family redox-sensitive transcriptional activator SoxR
MENLTIGMVAKLAGVRPSAIRYYESVGVLTPARRVRGQRRYAVDVLTHLAVIRAAQDLGFTVAEIRELFAGFPDDTTSSERWHSLARRKMAELDALIARAEGMRGVLRESLRCGCVTFADCEFVHTGRG